jgi:hypothetical protein
VGGGLRKEFVESETCDDEIEFRGDIEFLDIFEIEFLCSEGYLGERKRMEEFFEVIKAFGRVIDGMDVNRVRIVEGFKEVKDTERAGTESRG